MTASAPILRGQPGRNPGDNDDTTRHLLRLKGRGSLGVLGLLVKGHVGVSKVGELGRQFEDRQLSFAAVDTQFLKFLAGLSRSGRSLQGHTPDLLLAGVFVLDRQLGIITPVALPLSLHQDKERGVLVDFGRG